VVSCVAVLLAELGSVEPALVVVVTTIEKPPGLGAFQVSAIVGAGPGSRLVRVQISWPAEGAGQIQPEPTAVVPRERRQRAVGQ